MKPTRQAVLLVLFYAGVYLLSGKGHLELPSIILEPVKTRIEHDEFAKYTLRVRPAWLREKLKNYPTLNAQVLHDGVPVQTIAGQREISLLYDQKGGGWFGAWPCPWNASDGLYEVRLLTGSLPITGDIQMISRPFEIVGRKPPSVVPSGFAVLTVEDLTDLNSVHWKGPNGQSGDWRVLVDWAKDIHADALWILSADSGGYSTKLPDDHPWNDRAPWTLRMLGRECHRRGLKFGVWAMCYLVGGSPEASPNYAYAWEYDQGQLIDDRTKPNRRAISILDPKRPHDIARLLLTWADLPEVDYVGMDYIRNALGGFEMVDEFVSDMKVPVPSGWHDWPKNQRMLWLAERKVARQDPAFIDAWQWWRAHKAASVIRTVKSALGQKKPLWVFTLSWEKGWQHGQDPVMFRDAGADLDAIMLYECDKEQFTSIVHDWETYLRCGQVNLLAGDCIDWLLHQKDPAGPGEFKRRILTGYHHLCQNGPAQGVFIHDLLRALKGRLGPWDTQQWMHTARDVIAEVKRQRV